MSCVVDISDCHRHARWPALEIRRTVSAESGARSDRPAQGEGWLAGRLRPPGSSRCRRLSIVAGSGSHSPLGWSVNSVCRRSTSGNWSDGVGRIRSARVPGTVIRSPVSGGIVAATSAGVIEIGSDHTAPAADHQAFLAHSRNRSSIILISRVISARGPLRPDRGTRLAEFSTISGLCGHSGGTGRPWPCR